MLKASQCVLIKKDGLPVEETKLFQDLGWSYYNLLCVIERKKPLGYMVYSLIEAPTSEKLLERIKTAILAEYHKIKYVTTGKSFSPNEQEIIYFKNLDQKNNAILFVYLLSKYEKKYEKDQLNPLNYILNHLLGLPESNNRGYFIRQYIYKALPKKFADSKQMKDIEKSKELSYKEKYVKKYEFIQKHDKFKDFDKKYENVKKDAKELLMTTKKSADFRDFAKKTKIHHFKYLPKDHPLLNEKMKEDIKLYQKQIKS